MSGTLDRIETRLKEISEDRHRLAREGVLLTTAARRLRSGDSTAVILAWLGTQGIGMGEALQKG